jgi:uncharacterized membrane protein YagU involved in acid resistance
MGLIQNKKTSKHIPIGKGTFVMSTSSNRNSLLRLSLIGGIIIGLLHLIIEDWLVFNLLYKSPFISVLQFIASAALGNATFAGGIATALLGVLFHFFTAFVIATVFIFSADRIPLLRRNLILGSILYGFGAFVVMNFIVLPLSATPALPPPTPFQLIETIIDHMLTIGLPLGILVQRNK